MKIAVIAIGKARRDEAAALFDHYAKRIRSTLDLREIPEAKGRAADERMEREGQAILDALPKNAAVVALDPRGKTMTSETFAAFCGKTAESGRGLAFVIGGADGLAEAVRTRADLVLSLGTMTWPHLMVRAMLAEQIYRAETILAGHPYHRA
ncbi:MAG TPA: 23S rRNA (pseudouridine(1915)-N(3))-methyltransferase RlmH [Alphaproteobacteria bacterium]|nr:23S rRNA (pseudouridine(1915)-N(3))-methyltransferase RlmH [Alphaproteobacteria bacterium]